MHQLTDFQFMNASALWEQRGNRKCLDEEALLYLCVTGYEAECVIEERKRSGKLNFEICNEKKPIEVLEYEDDAPRVMPGSSLHETIEGFGESVFIQQIQHHRDLVRIH